MTFSEEFLENYDAKCLSMPMLMSRLHSMVKSLSLGTPDSDSNHVLYDTSDYTQIGQIIARVDVDADELLISVKLAGTLYEGYVSTSLIGLNVSSHKKLRTESCSYVGLGTFDSSTRSPILMGLSPNVFAISTDNCSSSNDNRNDYYFRDVREGLVRQLNNGPHPIRKKVSVAIRPSNFRNLLNKSSRSSGFMRLFVKDGNLAVVTSVEEEQAADVCSQYKATDLHLAESAEGTHVTVGYRQLYLFLYRKKLGYSGLIDRLESISAEPTNMGFGILENGHFFLEIVYDTLTITVAVPCVDSGEEISYSDFKVTVKKLRTSKKKDATYFRDLLEAAPTVEETPLPTEVVLSEEEQARIEAWRTIHESVSDTSADPTRWFASYSMFLLREGLQIPSEDLELVSRL